MRVVAKGWKAYRCSWILINWETLRYGSSDEIKILSGDILQKSIFTSILCINLDVIFLEKMKDTPFNNSFRNNKNSRNFLHSWIYHYLIRRNVCNARSKNYMENWRLWWSWIQQQQSTAKAINHPVIITLKFTKYFILFHIFFFFKIFSIMYHEFTFFPCNICILRNNKY